MENIRMTTIKTSKFFVLSAIVAAVMAVGCAAKKPESTDATPGTTAPAPAASTPAPKPTPQAAQKPAATPLNTQPATTGKVLVIGSALPAGVAHDVIGRVDVFQRSYGGIGDAFKLLGNKGREVGANAIVDARTWLAPAGFAAAAPHGSGIAVRVRDPRRLEEIGRTGGRWE